MRLADHNSTDIPSRTIVTRTKESDFPSLLRQQLSSVQVVEKHKVQTERVDANMECPKCGRTGIRYSEAQLRSADEGSTIFYNCDCGNRSVTSSRVLSTRPS